VIVGAGDEQYRHALIAERMTGCRIRGAPCPWRPVLAHPLDASGAPATVESLPDDAGAGVILRESSAPSLPARRSS